MRQAAVVIALLSVAISSAQSPKDQRIAVKNGALNTAPASKTNNDKQDTATPPNQTIAIYNQPSPAEHTGDNKQSQDAIDVERKLTKFTGYLVIIGFLQFLILAVQAVLFFQQRRIMEQHKASLEQLATAASDNAIAAKKSAEIAEAALKMVERADVLLDAASLIHGKVLSGKDARVVLQFKNFGRTKATDVWLKLNLVIEGVPESDQTKIPPISLGAGETKDASSPRFVEFLAEKTAQEIFTGTRSLSFEGEARYQDIFGSPHRSYYAGEWNGATDRFTITKQETD